MNNAQLAKEIKKQCQKKGIAISKMLNDCKIRKSLIYDLEKRDYTPSLEIAEQIADYLECSIDSLLERTSRITEYEESSEEQRLLTAFRQLTDEGQRTVLNIAEMSAQNPQYQKYTDIPKEA